MCTAFAYTINGDCAAAIFHYFLSGWTLSPLFFGVQESAPDGQAGRRLKSYFCLKTFLAIGEAMC